LKGEADRNSLPLRNASFYADSDITTMLGTRAVAIDRSLREVVLNNSERIGWDALILATGARARTLPVAGATSSGILTLRDAVDADRLKAVLEPGRRLAVVGGGYIGLEVAASARALGADVVVIEREARLLARVASPPIAEFFEAYHRSRGVAFELGADVDGFESHEGRVSGVVLRDGRVLACDAVLVGIGAIPNDELARAAGLDCEAGVAVDLDARTSDPNIFAVGDVTFRPLPLYGRMGRLESVPNAVEQARRAACAITGAAPPADEVPWFWSDQYDLKLQIAGLPFGSDELVIRGLPEAGRFAVFHLRGARILSVEALNTPAEYLAGKALIGSKVSVTRTALADPAISMKAIAAAALPGSC
jgi:3-phenylpropionate/trans-cinnamate dioxygenase ferredoxin reductase subunit